MIQSVEKNDIQLTVHTLCTHITNFVSIQCDKVVFRRKIFKTQRTLRHHKGQ